MENIVCPSCDSENHFEAQFDIQAFVCNNCHSGFENKKGKWITKKYFDGKLPYVSFKLGDRGTLKGKEYTITGVLKKRPSHENEWYEYILSGEDGSLRFVSESYGHWIVMEEVEERYNLSGTPQLLDYDEVEYKLYDYCNSTTIHAAGCFPSHFGDSRAKVYSYIYSNKIVSIEVDKDKNQSVFFGEHISWNEIRLGFSSAKKPNKSGVGIVQPFFISFYNLIIITISLVLLIMLTQIMINFQRNEQVVYRNSVTIDSLTSQNSYDSGSFELKGGAAPLNVQVQSNLDNSWATLDVVLVNEKTSEKIYASKDIEYYHGYSEGERWTEGNKNKNFNICGVKAGKYHLSVIPNAERIDSTTQLYVSAAWQRPLYWNAYLFIGFTIVLATIIYFIARNFEKRKWQFSDYSPYESE